MGRYITYAAIAIISAIVGGVFAWRLANWRYEELKRDYENIKGSLANLNAENKREYEVEIDKLKSEIHQLINANARGKPAENIAKEKPEENSKDKKLAKLLNEVDWDWYTKTWLELERARREAFKKQDETIITKKFLDKDFYRRFLDFQDKTNKVANLLGAQDPVDLMSNPKVASKLTTSFLKSIGINLTPQREEDVGKQVEKQTQDANKNASTSGQITTLDKLYIYGQQTVTFANYLKQTLSPEEFGQYMAVLNGDPFFGMPSVEMPISVSNVADASNKITDFWMTAFAFDDTKRSALSNLATDFATRASNLMDSNKIAISDPTTGLLAKMKQTVDILSYQLDTEKKIPTVFNFTDDELAKLAGLSGKTIKLTIGQ